MQNSRLIQLLKIFNTKELRELQQFVDYELFHSNKRRYKKVVQLFQKLISSKRKIQIPNRRILAIDLFGDKEDSDRNLSLHISQAIDLVQKYLVYKHQTKEPMKYNQTLLSILREKQAKKLFNQKKERIIKDLEKEETKNSDYFFNYFLLAKNSLELKEVRNRTLALNREDFKATITNLDLFFLVIQLNHACQALNINRVFESNKYELPILEIIIDQLPQTVYFQSPIIQIYWNTYKLLSNEEDNYYASLKSLWKNHHAILSDYYQTNTFNYLQNYIVQKISKGAHIYLVELWEISLFRLEKGLRTKLDSPTYKNLITTGTMLALQQESPDFSEVLNFMQNHTSKLQPGLQQEAQTYAQAYLAFYQNNFQIVPQKLITEQKPLTIYKFQDIFYQIDARRLLVMAFFRLEEKENNFDKLCSNLSVFLNERKEIIPELELEKNRQFLIIIKKLFWLPLNKSERKEKLEGLKKEVEEIKQISDRTWLLKQIEAKLK